jgi:hypothetical protein
MRLKYEHGLLTLVPETAADHAQIEAAFGTPYEATRCDGIREFSISHGDAVYLQPDNSVEVRLTEAWWNRDD